MEGKKEKEAVAPQRPGTFGGLPEKTRALLALYPARQPVKWRVEDDVVVVSYRKRFTPLERWLHKRLGGPTQVRRPLDECGTLIWTLCDGRHTVLEICDEVDGRFHESVEPVFRTVVAFLERLHRTGLIRMETKRAIRRPRRVAREGGRRERDDYLVLDMEDAFGDGGGPGGVDGTVEK